MDIKVNCADCGRHIGTFVRLGKKQDVEIEIHACYHKDIYDHIKEQVKQIKELETEIQEVSNQLYNLYDACNETTEPEVYGTILGLHERLEQALKGKK